MKMFILVVAFFGGLACIVAGIWVGLGPAAGLVATGFVCLFLSFVMSLGDDGDPEATDTT